MNAIQFIQQHGVDKAREVVEGAPDGATHLSDDACHYVNADFKPLPTHIKEQLPKLIVIDDIERLVESVDLIDSLGGLELSKKESMIVDFMNMQTCHIALMRLNKPPQTTNPFIQTTTWLTVKS